MEDSIYRLQQQAAERVSRMRAYERSIIMPEPLKPPKRFSPPEDIREPSEPPEHMPTYSELRNDSRQRHWRLLSQPPALEVEPEPTYEPPYTPEHDKKQRKSLRLSRPSGTLFHKKRHPHAKPGLGLFGSFEQDQILLILLALCLLQSGEDTLLIVLALLYVAL